VGVVGVAVAAGGGAFAATKLDSPSARSQAIISDAAGQLGIDPSKLTSALQKAIDDQIDADVKAGTLTKEQGDALKQRVDSGKLPLLGGFGLGIGPRGKFPVRALGLGPFGADADAAASYLGISTDELRSELQSGKTLAKIATDHGKTADGLVDALVAAAKKNLDKAVSAGRLGSDQEQTMLTRLKTLIQSIVNGTRPAPGYIPSAPPPGNGPMIHPGHNGFHFGYRVRTATLPPAIS
jgi:hypothetical protein